MLRSKHACFLSGGLSLVICCCFIVVQGCATSSGPGGDNENGGSTSTADCATTAADALVVIDEDDSTDLAASAVTSNCDEIAVYEKDGSVSQAAFKNADGDEVVAEFKNDQVIVVRSDEGDVLAVSYTKLEDEGADTDTVIARAEFEDSDGNTSASVFVVERDDGSGEKRIRSQAPENLPFCEGILQFVDVLAAGCESDPTQAYCDGPIGNAGQAAEKLCGGGQIEELAELVDFGFGQDEQDFELGINGFVTARAAEGGGTTFVCAAEAFGGEQPYAIEWSGTCTDGGITMTPLPGAAAIGDYDNNRGQCEFVATVTDDSGDTASDEILFNLGDDQFFGLHVDVSNDHPDVGEEVFFKATIQGADEGLEASIIFWEFGNGTSATGEEVSHTYPEEGFFSVFVQVIVLAECDFGEVLTIVVGDPDDVPEDGGFAVQIVASADSVDVGGEITLTPDIIGAIGDVEFGWGIINEDGQDLAELSGDSSGSFDGHDIVFGDEVTLAALAEGIVLVGVHAVDAAGQVAIDTKAIPIFGEDGGLFVIIEKPEFSIQAGVPETLVPLVIGGDGEYSYLWSVDHGSAELSDTREENPTITALEPGFVGLSLHVEDTDGNEADTFTGLEVFAEGFGDLFVEFLGPPMGSVGQDFPLHSFIGGGGAPYFCSWHVLGGAPAHILHPFACFETLIHFDEPGCVEVELEVEDIEGAFGVTVFDVCAGEFQFDCPFDDFCDPACDGFDPDCGDPCPFDGFCDEECPLKDPDCFEGQFCVPGDDICDHFCGEFGGEPDPDCVHCGPDDVCVFHCPDGPDPDCDREFCIPDDGVCDFGCFHPDPDCDDFFCQPGDGHCDFPCPFPDPDCGDQNNASLCEEFFFCCDGDHFCDHECPEADADCSLCGLEDNVCVEFCPDRDPDCEGFFGGECFSDADCHSSNPCDIGFCVFDVAPDGSEHGHCEFDFDPNCGGGECFDAFDCNDGNPCTFDVCHCETELDGTEHCGCYNEMDPACNGGGECFDDFECDDFNPCTFDYCYFETGPSGTSSGFCKHEPDPNCGGFDECFADHECDDFDPCTQDRCELITNADGTVRGECRHDADFNCNGGFCGDGTCGNAACTGLDCPPPEDCQNCPQDCPCDGICGDLVCDPGEDVSCPTDCNANAVCGNLICDPGEDSITCPTDCVPATACGNLICEAGEDATTCPTDCGGTATCGNGVCDSGESNTTCPGDCPL